MRALFVLPLVAAVLGLLSAPAAALVWQRRLGSLVGRLHVTAVALAAVVAIPILAYWNALGLAF